jgi:hypothetical protein
VSYRTRTLVTAILALLLTAPVFARVAQEPTSDTLDPVQLAAEGWTEESPGFWSRDGANGEHYMRVRGQDGLRAALPQLQAMARELSSRDFTRANVTSQLGRLLNLVAKIEADLTRSEIAFKPPCFRTGGVAVNVGTGPNCGAWGAASAWVSSNSYCTTGCDVYAGSYVYASCSPSGGSTGVGYDCTDNGTTVSCFSYSQLDRPYQCESAGGAVVYCGSQYYLDLVDYDDQFACQGGGTCDC